MAELEGFSFRALPDGERKDDMTTFLYARITKKQGVFSFQMIQASKVYGGGSADSTVELCTEIHNFGTHGAPNTEIGYPITLEFGDKTVSVPDLHRMRTEIEKFNARFY